MICSRTSLTARTAAAPRSAVRVAPVRPSVVVRANPGDELKQGARDVSKNVQRGAEDAKDKVSDAGNKFESKSDRAADDSEGVLKKAGKNINRAAEDAKDAVNDAAENVKEGAQDLGDKIRGKN